VNLISAVALCLPALATYASLRRIATGSASAFSRGLAAVVSPGLGVGFASCTYFLLLLVTGSHRTAVRLDAIFWVAVCAGVAADRVRIRRAVASRPAPSNQPAATVSIWRDPMVLVPAAGSLILATLATLSFWQHWAVTPHGEWDAWAIWNLRARAILRGAPDWTSVFSPAIAWSHVDYPLLLPIAVARLWAYTGQESPVIPAAVAMLFFASSLVTVATLVGLWRGWPAGFLAGMALIVPRTFVFQGSCQCGDIPIGFFILVAIAFVLIGSEAPKPGPSLFVAGAAAGLAAWTKNEGALLLILVSLVVVVRTLRFRALLNLAAGGGTPLIAIATFHLRIAPPSNYLFNTPGGGNISDKLFDPARWTMVTERLVDRLPAWGNVPAGAWAVLVLSVVLIAGPDWHSLRRAAWGLLMITTIFAGYSTVYVITPLPVDWQIATSFDRVVTQLWPALVWTVFQVTGVRRGEQVTSLQGVSAINRQGKSCRREDAVLATRRREPDVDGGIQR
jgi:hypothetical protein